MSKEWGICGSCDKHRPIAYKQGESPYHQWICIDCAQPTAAEIAALRAEVERLHGSLQPAVLRELAILRAEVERLRGAISEMPDCRLRFLNEGDYDAWLAWKIKYFNKNGELKQLEDE